MACPFFQSQLILFKLLLELGQMEYKSQRIRFVYGATPLLVNL